MRCVPSRRTEEVKSRDPEHEPHGEGDGVSEERTGWTMLGVWTETTHLAGAHASKNNKNIGGQYTTNKRDE